MVDTVMAETLGDRSWPERRTWIVTTDYSTGRRVVFGRDVDVTASLPDAVCASCAIPAWYAPVAIDGAAYVDGGTVSNTSTDLLFGEPLDEVYIFAPMAAVEPDRPRSPVSRMERRVRRAITRGIANDVAKLRADGAEVMLLTPGSEDLEAMGANLMNPRRRTEVLHTAVRTAAAAIRAQPNSDPMTAETGTT
jgi:NTE family protein